MSSARLSRFKRSSRHKALPNSSPSQKPPQLDPERFARFCDNLCLVNALLFRIPCTDISAVLEDESGDKRIIATYSNLPDRSMRRTVRNVLKSTNISLTTSSVALYYIYKLRELQQTQDGDDDDDDDGGELEVLVAALMTSSKHNDEHQISHISWARLSQINVNRLLQYEQQFLSALSWKLALSTEEFYEWGNTLQKLLSRVEVDPS